MSPLANTQSPWLDFIDRPLLTSGHLSSLRQKEGIRGLTSNPSIFSQALKTEAYDEQIKALSCRQHHPKQIYETLAVTDIRMAADALRPIFEESRGHDGFASLEVSPYLAGSTEGTLSEARRLYRWIGRDNVMIKIPASEKSLGAIKQALIEGIPVNVTLIFSRQTYKKILEIYLDALEIRCGRGEALKPVASVASFFISRIDAFVDRTIDYVHAARPKADLDKIRGKIAVATATAAYDDFQSQLSTTRFQRLQDKGAQPQKLLWASIAPKDPSFAPCYYVNALPQEATVITYPPKILDTCHTPGGHKPAQMMTTEEAEWVLKRARDNDLDEDHFAHRLFYEGVRKFQSSFDELLNKIKQRHDAFTPS